MADPPFPLGAAAQHAYDLLEPLAQHDATSGWPLASIVAGLAAGEEAVWRLVEWPGAGTYLDPATVPAEWLPVLAQAVGGRLLGGMSEVRQRAEVADPSGWMRGRPEHLLRIVEPYLQPPRRVRVRKRTNPATGTTDAPGHLQVIVRADDVLPQYLVGSGPWDAPELVRVIVEAIPAHLLGHVLVTNEPDWLDVSVAYTSWAEVNDENTDWGDLLTP